MIQKALRTSGLVLVALLAGAARVNAQLPSLEEFHVRAFDAGDGLPAGDVRHVAQSDDGYIYVATPRGLLRFDGYGFDRVPLPGFRTEFVESLLRDRRGRTWVVSAGNDLGYLQHGQFHALPSPPVSIGRFADLRDSSVWFAGPAGLTRVSADTSARNTIFTAADGLPHDSVDSVVDLGDGAPIVVTEWQLARLRTDTSFVGGVRFEPFGPQFAEALDVRVDSAGLWLAGRALDGTFFVLQFRDGRFDRRPVADSRSAAFAWTPGQVASLPRQTAWHTHAFTSVPTPDLPRNWLLDRAMVGRDGTQWLSLLGADQASYMLTRRRAGRLDTIPLPRDEPRAIRHFIEDHEGSIWVATDRGLLQLSSRKVFALGASHFARLRGRADGV